MRQQLAFSKFNIKINYIPRKNLAIIDSLSRILLTQGVVANKEPEIPISSTFIIEASPTIASRQLSKPNIQLLEADRLKQKEQLDDLQYKGALTFKLTRNVADNGLLPKLYYYITYRLGTRLRLIDRDQAKLVYFKRNRSLSYCLYKAEVSHFLIALYNTYSYFSNKITLQNIIR